MKKVICTILACGALAASSIPAALADELLLTSAPDAGYTVTADGKNVDLGANAVYEKGDNLMIPVRAVAESLGFKVEWNAERGGITLDDGTVNTTVYLNDDTYYMASSQAIGMSAPTSLGAAPELKNSVTFVPAKMFNILYCKENAVKVDGNVISISDTDDGENVQIPNPFTYYKTIDEAKKALSFVPAIPAAVPGGYAVDEISTLSDDFVQIFYQKGDNEILYRTAKGTDDISGDYNVYSDVKTVKISGNEVTVRKADKTASVIWTDGDYSYSLYADGGLTDKELSDIISSIR